MASLIPDPGKRPELRWVALKDLVIDRTYQREAHGFHAHRILSKFQWAYFQCVTVTDIGKGKFAVIDGQHRVLAARNHPLLTEVPVVVVDAPTVALQAQGFVTMNEVHKRITPIEMYWAGIAAENPDYLELESVLKAVGVKVHHVSGYSVLPAMTTCAVGTCLKNLRRSGRDSIENALRLLATTWPNKHSVFVSTLIDAVAMLLKTTTEYTFVELSRAMKPFEPIKLINLGRTFAAEYEVSISQGISTVIIERAGGVYHKPSSKVVSFK